MMIQKVKDISIYLTSRCNFNCTYCDRKYVVPSEINENDLSQIINFISYCFEYGCKPNIISFHGGEPLLKTELIYEIINKVENELSKSYPQQVSGVKYYIQTNGSLILKRNEILSSIPHNKLIYSISYDLIYQEKHRKKIEIDEIITNLIKNKYSVKLQCVASPLELNNPLFHSNLLQTCLNYPLSSFCILLLKHIRKNNYSEVVITKEEASLIATNLIKLIEMSYIYNFNLLIDGKDSVVETNYFNNHEQIILCGNGYLYPEYDFLDYDIQNARIGKWKNNIEFYEKTGELEINDICKSCHLSKYCGLKYVYYFSKQHPNTDVCITVYSVIVNLLYYMNKLKEKDKLYKWIIQ